MSFLKEPSKGLEKDSSWRSFLRESSERSLLKRNCLKDLLGGAFLQEFSVILFKKLS